MSKVETSLNEALFTGLQQERLILLHTIDHEEAVPTSSAISWVFAKDRETLRFALDKRSRLISNIESHPQVSASIFADNTIHILSGKAERVVEQLADVPIKLSCFDLKIAAVRDGMFYGARISVEPEYEKTYDLRAAEKLDRQVFEALRKA